MNLSVKGLVLSLITCMALEAHQVRPPVYLEHLSNGLTYCIACEEECQDELDINMMVRFDERFSNPREKMLCYVMQHLVKECLEETFVSQLGDQISLRKPQIFSIPSVVLYGMDLSHPTQERLDGILYLLSHSFASVLSTEVGLVKEKLEKFLESNPEELFKTEDEETLLLEMPSLPILSAEEVKNFSDFYYRPENMVLFVRGNLKNLEVKESIKNSFSSFFASGSSKPFRFGDSFNTISYQLASSQEEEPAFQIPGFKIISEEHTFEDLMINDKEVKQIERLMHTLATANFAKLIWKQRELEKIGRGINHVHPLKFISHIVQEPLLRSDLQEVYRNFFKWKGFMDGFRRRMTEEYYKGNLEKFLPGFCENLDIKQDVVEHFIERRDWEGLVRAVLF